MRKRRPGARSEPPASHRDGEREPSGGETREGPDRPVDNGLDPAAGRSEVGPKGGPGPDPSRGAPVSRAASGPAASERRCTRRSPARIARRYVTSTCTGSGRSRRPTAVARPTAGRRRPVGRVRRVRPRGFRPRLVGAAAARRCSLRSRSRRTTCGRLAPARGVGRPVLLCRGPAARRGCAGRPGCTASAFFVPLLPGCGVYVGAVTPGSLLGAARGARSSRLLGALARARAGGCRLAAVGRPRCGSAQEARATRSRSAASRGAGSRSPGRQRRCTRCAALGGAPLVTFAVALAGALLGGRRAGRCARRRWPVAASVGGAAVARARCAGLLAAGRTACRRRRDRSTVALSSRATCPQPGLDFNAERERSCDNHVDGHPASSRPSVAAGRGRPSPTW